MRHLLPCPPCGRQGRPGQGTWQARIHEPRGSAPRERDHRGGDHPVPSRTRQLSPPSPRVLQREAAGGQGVALAEGAFLYAPFERRPPTGRRSLFPGRARGGAPADAGGVRRMRRERPAGDVAPAGLSAFRARTASGACAFAAPSAAHRRRALAASPGKPSKGPCARGLVRRRTAVYHAPVGPQRGCSLAGPSSVLGRSRRCGRRYELCRRPFAPRGPLLGRFCSQHASEVLCGPPRGLSCVNGGLTI